MIAELAAEDSSESVTDGIANDTLAVAIVEVTLVVGRREEYEAFHPLLRP